MVDGVIFAKSKEIISLCNEPIICIEFHIVTHMMSQLKEYTNNPDVTSWEDIVLTSMGLD